jgi:hypothetical protein
MADYIDFPVEPPEMEVDPRREVTSNTHVKEFVFIGSAVGIVGIALVFLVNVWLGIVIIIIGAAGVIVGVFAPIR